MSLQHGPLVALPFNALARRAPTPDRERLWQNAFSLLTEQAEEYATYGCPRAVRDLYYDRFQYEGWSLDKIRRRRSTFLNQFTRQQIKTETHGPVIRRFRAAVGRQDASRRAMPPAAADAAACA